MKKKLGLLFIGMIAFQFGFIGPLSPALAKPFEVGEKLIYDLTWFGMKVGTARLEVEAREMYQDKDSYRIVSLAKSNKFISFFFPVEDRVESIIDAEEFYSRRIHVNQRHGSRHVEKEVFFDQEKMEAILIYKGKTHQFPIPGKMQDALSSLYFFRTFKELTVGESVFIDVHASKKNWRLEVEVLDHERVSVPLGTFDTIKTKAKVRYEGILMDKGNIFVWVTDDERKIPVLLKGKVSIGPFTASLSSGSLAELAAIP